jgi:hypothetical protein
MVSAFKTGKIEIIFSKKSLLLSSASKLMTNRLLFGGRFDRPRPGQAPY